MSIIFTKKIDPDNSFDNTTVTVETTAVTLPEILEVFQDFLRGSGFVFDGVLEIVEEEEELLD